MIIWLDVLMHDWTSAQVPAMVITIYLASQVGSRQEANFLHCYKLHQQSRAFARNFRLSSMLALTQQGTCSLTGLPLPSQAATQCHGSGKEHQHKDDSW